MSRKMLKLKAKEHIRGNIFILFIISIIASVDLCFGLVNMKNIFTTLAIVQIGPSLTNRIVITNSIQELTQQLDNTLKLSVRWSIVYIVLYYVVVCPLKISLARTYLNLANEEKPRFSGLGFGFKNCWEQSALLGFLKGLLLLLWSMLFVIPGIIKSYSYSMANYVMADEPDINALDAITKSRKLMRGYKFSLFILDLSFFFWYLLTAITFGIATIYVTPYIESTKANFYLNVKENAESM